MTTTTKKKLRPPFKIHGGKYYLSSWIIKHFPPEYEKLGYVEPFVGAGSVFLNKEPSEDEAINDLDEGAIQIWRALRDEPSPFIQRLKRTNYTELTFTRAKNREEGPFNDYIDHACNEFILRRMSRGGLRQAFAWSDRERGGQPGDVNAWETIVAELPLIAERIEKTNIFQKPAVEVIKAFDDEDFLCYCDPPYLPDTRVSKSAYTLEMTTDDHIELANALTSYRGKAVISGYWHPLYRRLYQGWRCLKKEIANHSGQSKTKTRRIECIWVNYDKDGKLL